MRARRDISLLLFVTLLGTYAYFWPWRGWNESTRLMLTYAIVDRGTIAIDGLEAQSGDISFVNGHYYSCKAPGQSMLGVPVYAALKLSGVAHPTEVPRIRYWWPDYVLNVTASALPTALLGVLLYWTALQLGCSHGMGAAVGLSYGLATPALPYATLFAGHQAAAFMAFAGLAVLMRCAARREWPAAWMALAGLLAGYAVVTEYPLVFAAAVLPGYALWCGCPPRRLTPFVTTAGLCALGLALYHTAAFGGPFQTGYGHLVEAQFHEVYTPENPIGLRRPTLERAWKLLNSGHGLVWYAPLVLLVPVGLVHLVRRGESRLACVVAVAFGSLFVINAAHPTWTGGWSTGPRYLISGLPFLMVPVAAALVTGRTLWRWCFIATTILGFLVCFAAAASTYGGRLPDLDARHGRNPIVEAVWSDLTAGRLAWNLGNVLVSDGWEGPPSRNWWALAPLVVFWEAAVLACLWFQRRRGAGDSGRLATHGSGSPTS